MKTQVKSETVADNKWQKWYGKKCIVLLWRENTGMRLTGRLVQRDSNWFEETECCPKGFACVYSRNMNEIGRAHEYAAQMRRTDPDKQCIRVLIMDDTEDVLTRARQMALPT